MRMRAALTAMLLPAIVAGLVPLLLARSGAGDESFRWAALVLVVPGAALLMWCVRELFARGQGTLAPWNPPRHLVSSGPYRFSRNPMYVGVTLVLFGWALGFGSWTLAAYAIGVLVAFQVRVLLHEEPLLARVHRDEWKRYAARVPRWLFPSRRAVAHAWLAILLALPLAGLLYEAYADGMAAREFTPPGLLVDVGGRRLHLLCTGEGNPTVFFEASAWGTVLSAVPASEVIASRARVCSYDRSGMGWSDPGPRSASAGDLARDLAVLQDRAGLRGPFLIVASGLGALTAQMFTRQYPERVAGLVLIDPSDSQHLRQRIAASRWSVPAACTAAALAHFGVARLVDPFGFGDDGSEGVRRQAALTYSARPWVQVCAMARGLPRTAAEFDTAPPMPAPLPAAVVSAAASRVPVPQPAARFPDFYALYTSSQRRADERAGRRETGEAQEPSDAASVTQISHPDAVADAVLMMLEAMPGRR